MFLLLFTLSDNSKLAVQNLKKNNLLNMDRARY